MKQNKYDEENFFDKYSQMERSIGGLEAAGEWHILKTMLPSFQGKQVLDIGCGFGWHCRYAAQEGAKSVIGIDISSRMLNRANALTEKSVIRYECVAIEDAQFESDSFDVVMSSLAFHYVQDFNGICQKVYDCLVEGGDFIFSCEHPIFTASEGQDWCYGENDEMLHWPVDDYQMEGIRQTTFLGEDTIKYHRTLETYLTTLIRNGFRITRLSEPVPSEEMMKKNPFYRNELRRPMFLMIAAKKSS